MGVLRLSAESYYSATTHYWRGGRGRPNTQTHTHKLLKLSRHLSLDFLFFFFCSWIKSINMETNTPTLKPSHRHQAQASQLPNIRLLCASPHRYRSNQAKVFLSSRTRQHAFVESDECFLRRWETFCMIEHNHLLFCFLLMVIFILYWRRIKYHYTVRQLQRIVQRRHAQPHYRGLFLLPDAEST